MKFVKYLTVIIIFTTVIGFNQNLFSWGLFNLFTDQSYTQEGLNAVEDFNPDKDILYLPQIGDKDIFESMDDLSICRKPEVRKFIFVYLTRGREYTIRSIERSYLYKDIISDIFKKEHDIPEEIALLPLLESGFNPHAVSRSRAVGLWQFVSNTSKPLGLKNDRWIDERKDIEKSTEAAIRHLRHLYAMFNSWELALSAYNGGAGHVARAIKKTGTKNIWELSKTGALSSETSEYLCRFIALVMIYKNQRLFDIYDEIMIPETHKTETFIVKYPIKIKELSLVSGVPEETIETYNPELNQSIIPPYYKNYSLRVPVEAKEKLRENEKELYRNKFSGVKKHRIRKGECLSLIAQHYKTNTRQIMRFNGIRDPDNLKVGEILYIPF
ncbi:MAG TPA: transglycosylase SLT domain-containing protein [Spirochaetota bacterium]|nr:transglycosylase SLT domain-containing protein [Spirochaetota bacterium]HPI89936.1 transglycosylase SLT domain-containing protein [Spirochaetota bacterium]HPR48465.1 transglycosylase SLT domain-containing protein [Spirochaetota bacterium]